MSTRWLKKLRLRIRVLLGKEVRVPIELSRPSEFHGSQNGGWTILANSLGADSVVYSFGVGEDASFDLSLIKKYACRVFGFDPTPKSIAWVRREIRNELFQFHALAISDQDGVLRLFCPCNPDHVSACFAPSARTSGQFFDAPCETLSTTMRRLGHPSVHVLKMDIEGAEYGVLDQAADNESLGKVHQLLVEFHHWMPPFTIMHTKGALRRLSKAGFRVAWVSTSGHEILFVNTNPPTGGGSLA
jgi:FkbM family methyltransferase